MPCAGACGLGWAGSSHLRTRSVFQATIASKSESFGRLEKLLLRVNYLCRGDARRARSSSRHKTTGSRTLHQCCAGTIMYKPLLPADASRVKSNKRRSYLAWLQMMQQRRIWMSRIVRKCCSLMLFCRFVADFSFSWFLSIECLGDK